MDKMRTDSNRQMVKLLLSTVTGNFGSGMLSFIIGLLILKNTDSALSFGISQIIGPLVSLILLPFTGSLVDKFDRKKIIVMAQCLSIVSLLIYALFLFFDGPEHLIYTYILLIFLRISDQFLSTATIASVINIVTEEHIQKVKSLQQSLVSLTLVVSPIAAAFLYDILPLATIVLAEIGLEIVTILIILSINFHFLSPEESSGQADTHEPEPGIFLLFKEGLTFIFTMKNLVFAVLFSMLINFMLGAVNVGLPYMQINVLHFSNYVYGWTEALISLGMILSGIVLSVSKESRYPLHRSWQMINVIGILLLVFGLLLSSGAEQIYAIIIVSVFNLLLGIVVTQANVPVSIWMTKQIPKHYQGRVFNIINTGAQLLAPLGILLFSVLFEYFDAFTIFIAAGAVMLAVTLLYPLLFRVNLKENILSASGDTPLQAGQ
ncbi:MFS transporter ['Paenibacillus yunnanensis' Narsing Rao et al. 2020]|uniref:MFS transporter n=1 Tax=Paenibacillus tengchongensis TaxID=2608684 RepID=UPI00124D2E6B|nr:MFS transporter [Paenibacillus tengchongensis]